MSLPVPAPAVAFKLVLRDGEEALCRLAIFGPSLPAGFPSAQFSVFFCLFCFFFSIWLRVDTRGRAKLNGAQTDKPC